MWAFVFVRQKNVTLVSANDACTLGLALDLEMRYQEAKKVIKKKGIQIISFHSPCVRTMLDHLSFVI